jgi:hypothetical protein
MSANRNQNVNQPNVQLTYSLLIIRINSTENALPSFIFIKLALKGIVDPRF